MTTQWSCVFLTDLWIDLRLFKYNPLPASLQQFTAKKLNVFHFLKNHFIQSQKALDCGVLISHHFAAHFIKPCINFAINSMQTGVKEACGRNVLNVFVFVFLHCLLLLFLFYLHCIKPLDIAPTCMCCKTNIWLIGWTHLPQSINNQPSFSGNKKTGRVINML